MEYTFIVNPKSKSGRGGVDLESGRAGTEKTKNTVSGEIYKV